MTFYEDSTWRHLHLIIFKFALVDPAALRILANALRMYFREIARYDSIPQP